MIGKRQKKCICEKSQMLAYWWGDVSFQGEAKLPDLGLRRYSGHVCCPAGLMVLQGESQERITERNNFPMRALTPVPRLEQTELVNLKKYSLSIWHLTLQNYVMYFSLVLPVITSEYCCCTGLADDSVGHSALHPPWSWSSSGQRPEISPSSGRDRLLGWLQPEQL